MLKNIIINCLHERNDPARNTTCTEFEVDNWSISRFVVKRLVQKVGWHPFPLTELALMTATLTYFKPTHIFEWGTHVGKSARIFYEAAKYFRIKTEIHSIDLPDEADHVEHPRSQRGKLVRGLKEVTLHQGDGLDTALRLIKEIPGPFRPLFYLDGDHSYESVKRELTGIISNVPNATILLHDTFYQSKESNYNIGPYIAIQNSLANCGKGYKTVIMNTGLPGMVLLYKKAC
jgi:hypothetical protein